MEMFSKRVLNALLVSALLLFPVACSKHANDGQIAQDVQSKVASDPATQDSTINVTSKDGTVTLRGTAKDAAAQQRAEQIARAESGVSSVDDETAVAQGAPASSAAAAPAPAPEQQQPPPPPQPIVVPAGTALNVTIDEALSSKTSQAGQTFRATLASPVRIEGKTAIPKGSRFTGNVITAKEKGKIKGEGELVIALNSVTVHGKDYTIQTGTLDSTVKGKGKRTAATTGGGAAGGALIGGLAGGGKGAGIGALVGAGAGLVGGTMTGNKQIQIPAESALTFTLSQSLTLPPPAE